MKWCEWFLGSNDLTARLLRTIVESVIGFCVANFDVFFSQFSLPAEWKFIIMGITVSIMSPILAMLRAKNEEKCKESEKDSEQSSEN